KELLKLFSARGIDVIRIGLQTSEKISLSGDILAGPYHPALRELVEAKWARERLEQLLLQAGIQPSQTSGSIIVEISPQDVSIVRGQRNSNISYFRKFWGIEELKLKLNPSLSRRTMLLVGEYTN
ncbi:MAG TPA: radical SAM protein, partial [Bacillota bacterium]|nr:radical SAM protein [Bacillota bacterium]